MSRSMKRIVNEWNKANVKDDEINSICPSKAEISKYWKRIKQTVSSKGKERTHKYLLNSSINCYRYLADDTLQVEEKITWWFVHLSSLCVAGFVIYIVATSALKNPIGTSEVPGGSSLSSVPYPGVALCTLNRLSKKRVTDFARSLIAKNRVSWSEDNLINILGYLGYALYNVEPPDEIFDKLHDILYPYDLKELFYNLSPQCDDLMVRCSWRNQLYNCSSLFKVRKTSRGPCCTFNYMRESEFAIKEEKKMKGLSSLLGQNNGLSVVLDPQLEDYMYTRIPSEGTKVMIFNPSDYPDATSGGCFDEVVGPQIEKFIYMDATVLTASKSVEEQSFNVRGCVTDSDKGSYSSSNECYLMCKIRSIYGSCGCVPFYLPLSGFNRFCSLKQEECIRRWKKSWDNSWAGDESSNGDENGESTRIVPCSECKPFCSDIKYGVGRYTLPLQPDAINYSPDSARLPLKRGTFFRDHSVVHIYFTKETFTLLQSDVLFSWYDWLSNIGGLCGLVLGCSIISIGEIIYFYAFGGPADAYDGTRQNNIRQLYWKEIKRTK